MPDHYGFSIQQRRVDAIQAQARKDEARKRLFKPAPPSPVAPAKTDDVLSARLSEELAYIGRMLEGLGDRLVMDPIVVQRHADALQTFDLVGQLLGHLADVIGADDRQAVIDTIGMRELKTRLTRKPLH